ncbi:hypothetical protein C8R46DRAFT_1193842 [Mycena filopes]|nr:hypothetical protein C8R46DRAFT_1193842 [Mycena filopes]
MSHIRIQCLLFDRIHRQGYHPVTVVLDKLTFGTMPISAFHSAVEKEHLTQWKHGGCGALCLGGLDVKAAWLITHPIATAYEITRNLTELDLYDFDSKGATFMPAGDLISAHIHFSEMGGVVVLESIPYKVLNAWKIPSKSPLKRSRELAASDGEGSKKARQNLPSRAPGLCIIPSTENPDAPLNLLPPHFVFSAYSEYTGGVFIDKTPFIYRLSLLLRNHPNCIVVLPPSTGKTTFLSMLIAWFERRVAKATWDKLFQPLEMGRTLHETDYPFRESPGPRSYLCLHFDLKKVERGTDDQVAASIEKYLMFTMQLFALTSQAQLGLLALPPSAPQTMLRKLANRVVNQCGYRLFIAVDHWEAPIITSLSTLGLTNNMPAATTALTTFIGALLELSPELKNEGTVHVLIMGNLHLFDDEPRFDNKKIKNISLESSMDGAFGISRQELISLATLLSLNRQRKLDLALIRAGGSVLNFELGMFSPPALSPQDSPPDTLYKFDLTLHYVTTTLDLSNGHKVLADSPILQAIGQRCRRLLEHSSIRRDHLVNIDPARGISSATLSTFATNEKALLPLLVYLGALKVTDPHAKTPDPVWTVKLCSSYATKQLFSTYSVILNELDETHRAMQLRALFGRDTTPMSQSLCAKLTRKSLRDLYNADEGVLQTLVEGWFEVPDAATDRLGFEEVPKYIDHYFSQVGLCTDPEKIPTGESGPDTKGKGKQGTEPSTSTSRAGQSAPATLRTQPRVASTRVQTRQPAPTTSRTQPRAATRASNTTTRKPVPGSSTTTRQPAAGPSRPATPTMQQPAPGASRPGTPVEGATAAKVDHPFTTAGLGPWGFLDSLLLSLEELFPGRIIALELKLISLFRMWRIEFKSHQECLDSFRTNHKGAFTKICLERIEEINKLSLKDLKTRKVRYSNNEVTVGQILEQGEVQLRSYMRAIIHGKAKREKKGKILTPGFTPAERRIVVTTTSDPALADEVLGFVVCAVGRRVVVVEVEPERKNTENRYSAASDWQTRYEVASKDYNASDEYYAVDN